MTTISKAIKALNEDNNNSHEFVVHGEPSNQTEYQQNVKYVSGSDDNGSAIFSDTQPYTWSEVNAKKSALQTNYDNEQYKRDRKDDYLKKKQVDPGPGLRSNADMHDNVLHGKNTKLRLWLGFIWLEMTSATECYVDQGWQQHS